MNDTDDSRKAREAAEDAHRSRVNKIAAIGLALMLLVVFGIVKLFVDHETLQNCVDSGRKNCFDLNAPPREGVRIPVR